GRRPAKDLHARPGGLIGHQQLALTSGRQQARKVARGQHASEVLRRALERLLGDLAAAEVPRADTTFLKEFSCEVHQAVIGVFAPGFLDLARSLRVHAEQESRLALLEQALPVIANDLRRVVAITGTWVDAADVDPVADLGESGLNRDAGGWYGCVLQARD